jgi:hypothetical protein
MAARYYDPRFGRFSSRDPEHTPMSPYAYCLNNPVSFVDPTGHSIGGGCGGCYTAYFSQNYWKLAYYAPMPQLPPVSDPSLSFGNNPIFRLASLEIPTITTPFEELPKQRVTQQMIDEVFLWLYKNHGEFRRIVEEQRNKEADYENWYRLMKDKTASSLAGLVYSVKAGSKRPEIRTFEYVYTEKLENVYIQLGLSFLHEEVEIYVIQNWHTVHALGAGIAHDIADEYMTNFHYAGFFADYPVYWEGSNVGQDMSGWWETQGATVPPLGAVIQKYLPALLEEIYGW